MMEDVNRFGRNKFANYIAAGAAHFNVFLKDKKAATQLEIASLSLNISLIKIK